MERQKTWILLFENYIIFSFVIIIKNRQGSVRKILIELFINFCTKSVKIKINQKTVIDNIKRLTYETKPKIIPEILVFIQKQIVIISYSVI